MRFGLFREPLLNLAIRGGNLQVVTLLLEAGAKIDAGSGGCQTPLMVAAATGDVEMAKLLIAHHAYVNSANSCQSVELAYPATALIAACVNGHSDMARFLIDAGADVHHRDARGDTALDCAINWRWGEDSRQTLETVVVLVQAGADGPRALVLIRQESYRGGMDLVNELAKILHEAGAPDSFRLAFGGEYSQIAEYLKDWKSADPLPAE